MNRAFLLSVLVGVVGCASAGAGPAGEGDDLTVLIEPSSNGWIIRTNRPSSVALFEVFPNNGVGLLFPDPSREDGHINAGNTRIVTGIGGLIKQHRAAYINMSTGFDGARVRELRREVSPRVVLALVCECTLNLDAVARPDGLTNLFGSFPPANAQVAAIRLIEELLPSPDVSYALARY